MNAGGCGLGHSHSALSTAGQGPGPRSFINQSSGGRGGSLVGASLSEDGSNSNSNSNIVSDVSPPLCALTLVLSTCHVCDL